MSNLESIKDEDGKMIVIRGVIPNMFINGRYYPPEVWKKALEDPAFVEHVSNRRQIVTLGLSDDGKIHMDKAAGVVTEAQQKDDSIIIDVELLDTPSGNVVREMLESSRIVQVGIGTTRFEEGPDGETIEIINDDYCLSHFGIVPKEETKNGAIDRIVRAPED